jgi:lipopolysaccharide transport system ATP-binding protein
LLEVGTGFHPELTGRENIFMNGTILGMKMKEIEAKFDEIVAFAEIEQFIDTPVKRYSSGMYVRLAFAVAAHLESEILLIDEVLAVGDAEFQKKCLGKMGDVARAGRTVLFVSHNMPAIQNLCGRAVVIHHGRVEMDDVPEKAIAHYIETCGASRGAGFQRDPATIPASAAASVASARLENGDGELAGGIPMGEGFTVRMRVTARETVESFMAALAIADAMGTRLCGINSRDTNGAVFSLRAGEQVEVVCRVPRLNLLPGVYALNLGLQRTVSREALDYFAGALSFEVLPRDVFGTGKIPHGPGHMYLSSEWTAEG